MKKNELKFLANLAKQRLINKNYEQEKSIKKNTASSYFIQNAKALKRLKAETNYVTIQNKEDEEFVSRVRELLDTDCYNPLGVLCDNSYFSTLNEFEKEFYILNLSEKYNKVKNELLCG
ncbi:MAG: hypothetical protein E7345_00730 [Clostridiales bacterium]|nr:hypothetical protein [Clostridiales bacterium]